MNCEREESSTGSSRVSTDAVAIAKSTQRTTRVTVESPSASDNRISTAYGARSLRSQLPRDLPRQRNRLTASSLNGGKNSSMLLWVSLQLAMKENPSRSILRTMATRSRSESFLKVRTCVRANSQTETSSAACSCRRGSKKIVSACSLSICATLSIGSSRSNPASMLASRLDPDSTECERPVRRTAFPMTDQSSSRQAEFACRTYRMVGNV